MDSVIDRTAGVDFELALRRRWMWRSKLMCVLAEGDDPRTPLRHEAPGHRPAASTE